MVAVASGRKMVLGESKSEQRKKRAKSTPHDGDSGQHQAYPLARPRTPTMMFTSFFGAQGSSGSGEEKDGSPAPQPGCLCPMLH